MTVDFKFALGEKVFIKSQASKGILDGAKVSSAVIMQEEDQITKYYRTDFMFSHKESDLVNESDALDLAIEYHKREIAALLEIQEKASK